MPLPADKAADFQKAVDLLAAQVSLAGHAHTNAGRELARILEEMHIKYFPTSKSAKDVVPEHYTQPFLDFINENPTVFHTVDYFSKELEKEGFVKLSERKIWNDQLKAGGKYYITRNGSSLVAFSIPQSYKPGNGIGMFIPIL